MMDRERYPRPPASPGLPPVSPGEEQRLLTDLLKGVSRSFYLTLRVLPKGLREPVGLAYLLAKAADTVADTRLLPPAQRLGYLLTLRAQLEGPASIQTLRDIEGALTEAQSDPAEMALLLSLPQAFTLFEGLPQGDRALVRSVAVTLTRGMEMDLTTFPPEDSGQVAALQSTKDLDRYIYYVAGCVGEFWTAITMAHTKALANWDPKAMAAMGVGFGKALQLTNVLRDVPRDLRMGRCYLPLDDMMEAGLEPEDLLHPLAGERARPVLVRHIETALGHYEEAESYLLAIPVRCLRLRLAAAWPTLIGLSTLAELAQNRSWLDPDRPSRVNRRWVYRMLALSTPAALSDFALRTWVGHLRRMVERALA